MARRLRNASALILAGFLAASPACAVKDFSPNGLSSPGSSVQAPESAPVMAPKPLNNLRFPAGKGGAATAVRGSRGWLLMLAGFGLLGALGRRSEPHPMHDQLGL